MIKVTNQIGKELRLSRFLNPDSKRTVMVAYAHGILMGPMKGMETNEEIKIQNETLKAADAVLMPMGFLPSCQELFTGKNRSGDDRSLRLAEHQPFQKPVWDIRRAPLSQSLRLTVSWPAVPSV